MNRTYLSIGLISSSVLAFQLSLMQLLSISQWHHFAALVISVALLGFGASGTYIALFRKPLLAQSDRVIPWSLLLSGVSMAGAFWVTQLEPFRFDSLRVFVEWEQLLRVAATCLVLFIPFFCAALAIGLFFVRETREAGRIYFANMVGSGSGGVIAVLLMFVLLPEELPPVAGAVGLLAAGLSVPRRGLTRFLVSLGGGLLFVLLVFFLSPPPLLSEYKDLSRIKNLPGAEITYSRQSPYGLLQVASSPALRYAPGVSLAYGGDIPVQSGLFNNGDWYGPLDRSGCTDTMSILDVTTLALPYLIGPRDRVLVLGSGTGSLVDHALRRGAKEVVGVEEHATLVSLLRGALAGASDSLAYAPGVRFHGGNPRTYLLSEGPRFDLITLPLQGSVGGSSGLTALREEYVLTVEAIQEMWNRLTDSGAISVSTWMDYPFRAPLRIAATLKEVLSREGITSPAGHLAAVRSWGTISYVVSRSRLDSVQISRIREFCTEMGFDPALLPDLESSERARYNRLEDSTFFGYLDQILSGESESVYRKYPFRISPCTDDRPFFSQFLKWSDVFGLDAIIGPQGVPFLEIGYLLVVVTLFQAILLSSLLIVAPLFAGRRLGRGLTRTVAYFGGLGIGYIFVEMFLIQKFVLPLGGTILSAAVVMGALLISSGWGSLWSTRYLPRRVTLLASAGTAALGVGLYAIVVPLALPLLVALPPLARLAGSVILIAPLGFVMGMPFPLGLRVLSESRQAQVAWAWGINGCTSVVSTSLAVVVAVEVGFLGLSIAALGMYTIAFLANAKTTS
ncbi:MAG: class I SAM-dependent methyltransferase [Bacteroidota bacterium]